MTPLRRLCDFFTDKTNVVGEDANKEAGTRIVSEIIESRVIDAGGAGYVIRGKFIKSSGQKIFEVGEVVNVLFKEDDPIVILGHTWRKAQFEEEPIPAPAFGTLEIVSPAIIELPPKIDPETGQPEVDPETGDPIPQFIRRFVIFTGAGQFAIDPEFPALNPEPERDPETGEKVNEDDPDADVLTPFQAAWGENGNHILLRFEILDDPTAPTSGRDFLQAFKVNRKVDSTKMPLKKDPDDQTKILKLGDIPVVDGELVGNRIEEFDGDIPLRRGTFEDDIQKLTVRENVILKTFHDIELNGEAAENGILETVFKQNETQETFEIEEEREMLVGGLVTVEGRFDSTGYGTGLYTSFLDGENQIIQIYTIEWFISELFSNSDELITRIKLSTASTSDDIMPTVSELLTAAGFLQPTMAFPLGDPDDLPDLSQGISIIRTGSIDLEGPHADAAGFDLDGIFFEPFANLLVSPSNDWFDNRPGVFYDVFALKRDTSQVAVKIPGTEAGSGPEHNSAEDVSLIVGASFEEELTFEYDREVMLPMSVNLFRSPQTGEDPHIDTLSMSRPIIGVSNAFPNRSFIGDFLNVLGPFYFTDDFGGGLARLEDGTIVQVPITVGADGQLDQIGFQDPGPPSQIFPQSFALQFPTINNVKFRGRSLFGDLRPELPDVVKEPKTVQKVFNTLALQPQLQTDFFGFLGPGEITTPESSVNIDTFELTHFEEHEPDFTGGTFALSRVGTLDPLLNKGAIVIVAGSTVGEDQDVLQSSLPIIRKIIRWDYANPSEVDDPVSNLFESRGPNDFFLNGVAELFAHDGAIYVRWSSVPPFVPQPNPDRIFIAPRAGEPEGAGERTFTPGKEPSTVAAPGFVFIKPGRGKPGQIAQSYSFVGRLGDFISERLRRDRIHRITVNDSDGLAEMVLTSAAPNSDVRRLNPKVRSFVERGQPSYHYAGVK